MEALQLAKDRHENFLNIEGSINLRDFGGYTTTDGKQIRRGLLYRCGLMTDIPEHAWDDFAALDVGVICDLRSHEEVESNPTPDAEPFNCRVHIPIWPGSSQQFQNRAQQAGPQQEQQQPQVTHDEFIEFMHRVTREIARDHVEAYKQLMRELIQTERGFLLHCSAGKDRTGFGAALIHHLLGVDHDTILADYLISNQATELGERFRSRMEETAKSQDIPFEIDDEIIKVFAGVREEYLLGAFEELDQHYGGIHGYLEEIGITAAEEKHLRDRLLV